MFETLLSSVRHLWFGFKALLFLRVDRARQTAVGPEPVFVALLLGLLDIGRAALEAGEFRLSAWGVTALVATTGLLAAALLLAGSRRRGVDTASLVATLLAMTLLGQMVETGAGMAAGPLFDHFQIAEDRRGLAETAVQWVGLGWFLVAVSVYAARAAETRPRGFGLAATAAVLASLFVLPTLPVADRLGDDDASTAGLLQSAFDAIPLKRKPKPAEPSRKPLDVEAIYARQPALIDAALDGLRPAKPGTQQLHFVGMAAYSGQDVFKREIVAARDIVNERFQARGHSLVLINHRESVEAVPLANATNLERVLSRLSGAMDVENDILVLFITTHGSDGILSVRFPGFSLNDLTPAKLADILARSGIRNRVIILSACHAGSFLEVLSGPDTLVMAAARADRASFGCSNERDWTYFGDALFNHALRETRSFPAAFEKAKALVARWESEQKLAPASEPQMSLGQRIAVRLDALAQALEANAAPRPVSD